MKASSKIIVGMLAVAATGTLILLTRHYNTNRRLAHIANEGYETAHDILYPKKYNRGKKLLYGPVLPADNDFENIY
ncbi:MAG: hypothetical protein ABIO05_09395 [Ferruginibacter sp.]